MKLERGFYTRLRTLCGASEEQARQIRRVLESLDLEPCPMTQAWAEPCPMTQAWIESCYNPPSEREIILAAIDEILGNYGVEAEELRPGRWLEYSNTGDSYAPTVVLWRGVLRISSWGDIVEREATE